MKPWKTILEDQTMKAQAQIQHLLKKEDSESRSKKGIAIAMATIGIALIAVGIFPFFSEPNNNDLKAAVPVFDDELPKDIEEPETTGSISFNPDPVSVVVDSSPVEEITDHEAAPTENIPDSEEINIPEELTNNTMNSPIEIDAPEVLDLPTNTQSNTSPFRVNTHTGLTTEDTEEITINTENNTSKTLNTENKDNLHSAAPSNADSGPEMWLLVVFSVTAAIFIRRKKQFSMNI